MSGTAAQEERAKWSANERTDRLVEALRPLLSWAESVSQHHAMLRSEPPFTTTKALNDAIASVHAVLRDRS